MLGYSCILSVVQSSFSSSGVDPALLEKFPELVELIAQSQSMNGEEREYWFSILPIMTPEQITNLQDILLNERRQLAAIDAKYAKELDQVSSKQALQQMDTQKKEKRQERSKVEHQYQQDEQKLEEDILQQIDAL